MKEKIATWMGTLTIYPFLFWWCLELSFGLNALGAAVWMASLIWTLMNIYNFKKTSIPLKCIGWLAFYKVYQITFNKKKKKRKVASYFVTEIQKPHSNQNRELKNRPQNSLLGTNLSLSTSIFLPTAFCQGDYLLSNISSFLNLV